MKESMTVLLPEGIQKRDLKQKAFEIGIRYTVLAQEGIGIVMDWDAPFYHIVKDWAEGLNVSVGRLVENLILGKFAQIEAQEKVWGKSEEILPEFTVMGKEMLTGEPLSSFLTDWYTRAEERKRVNLLLREEEEGIPLSDDDKAFLIKKRAGRTWLESEEFAQEQREREEAEARLTPKQRKAAEYSREITRKLNRIFRQQGEEAAHEYIMKVRELEKSEGREAALKYTPDQ